MMNIILPIMIMKMMVNLKKLKYILVSHIFSEIAGSTLGIVSLAELPNEAEENFNDSDDSDKEDDIIKSDDNLIIAGRVDGDASILEIYGNSFMKRIRRIN